MKDSPNGTPSALESNNNNNSNNRIIMRAPSSTPPPNATNEDEGQEDWELMSSNDSAAHPCSPNAAPPNPSSATFDHLYQSPSSPPTGNSSHRHSTEPILFEHHFAAAATPRHSLHAEILTNPATSFSSLDQVVTEPPTPPYQQASLLDHHHHHHHPLRPFSSPLPPPPPFGGILSTPSSAAGDIPSEHSSPSLTGRDTPSPTHTHHERSTQRSTSPPTITSRPPPPPPRREPAEPRQVLIERERQARKEGERARLKQLLALSREREEEELAFQAVDVARRGGFDIGLNGNGEGLGGSPGGLLSSTRGGVVVGRSPSERQSPGGVLDIEEGVRNVHVAGVVSSLPPEIVETDNLISPQEDTSCLETEGMDHSIPTLGNGTTELRVVPPAVPPGTDRSSQSPLGFTMERFLSDGVPATALTANPPHHDHDTPNGSHSHHHDHMHNNDSKNVSESHILPPIDSGLGMEPNDNHTTSSRRRSSETSSVLSDWVARDEELDAMVEATTNGSGRPPSHHERIDESDLIAPPHHSILPSEGEDLYRTDSLSLDTNTLDSIDGRRGGDGPSGGGGGGTVATGGGALINLRPDDLPIIEPSSTMDMSVENQVSSRNSNHSDLVANAPGGVDGIISIHAELDQSITSEVSSTHVGRDAHAGGIQDDGLPRLAQLTEAEILEMAEIDYASVGNMPPRSVRDEQHLPSYNDLTGLSRASHEFSEVTHTTAQESISISIPSGDIQSGSNEGCEDIQSHSLVNDYLSTDKDLVNVISPGDGSNISVLVNRSESSESDPDERKPPADLDNASSSNDDDLKWITHDNQPRSNDFPQSSHPKEEVDMAKSESKASLNSSSESYDLPNRTIRPGMAKMPVTRRDPLRLVHQRSLTTPNIPSFVDDFDYCKYDNGPLPLNESNLNLEAKNPDLDQNMENEAKEASNVEYHVPTLTRSYGAAQTLQEKEMGNAHLNIFNSNKGESMPLLSISASQVPSSTDRKDSIDELVGSVFSSARSLSTEGYDNEFIHSESYLKSGAFSRAFPERGMTLLVTAIIEIPVFLMIVGRDDNVCLVLGKSRYQLFMAFLPISMALSGNCGLQASTLSTRGISNEHVTKENYWAWFFAEVKVAAILGIAVGSLLGAAAYQTSDFDALFGFTICVANIFSTLVSGILGTFSPLLFTFVFQRELRKWGGLIQIAIQDIVGCFSMIVISYRLLAYFGINDDDDVC